MPSYYGASDIQLMLDEFGVSVVFGSLTVKAIIETPDQTLWQGGQAGGVMGQVTMLVIKTGALPGLAANSLLTADGVSYKVIQVQKADDGALTHVFVTLP